MGGDGQEGDNREAILRPRHREDTVESAMSNAEVFPLHKQRYDGKSAHVK